MCIVSSCDERGTHDVKLTSKYMGKERVLFCTKCFIKVQSGGVPFSVGSTTAGMATMTSFELVMKEEGEENNVCGK